MSVPAADRSPARILARKLGGELKPGHLGVIAAAPGVGFGRYGDEHVRLALIENEARIRQAVRGIKEMFRKDDVLGTPGSVKKDSARAA